MVRSELCWLLCSADIHLGENVPIFIFEQGTHVRQIGYTGATNSLLASGVYGVVKVVATTVFIFFFADAWGRKPSLFVSAVGMGTLFFILGAILKTHPPSPTPQANPPASGKAMAATLYIYVCFYSMGWGPLPWVYVSDIFPTRTRHYGLAVASSSQWLWSMSFLSLAQARFSSSTFLDFVVSKATPTIHTRLGYKMFLMFAALNIGAMAPFSLCVLRCLSLYQASLTRPNSILPETKGRSLEEMDIIFGAVSAEARAENISRQEQGASHPFSNSGHLPPH
jgi:hypothetical protein